MNKKENKGYQVTHRRIIDALMELLKEKDIQRVTVVEICRKVQINRSTFYEHFVDVYDVLEKVAAEISARVQTITPAKRPEREDFIALFCHIREYKDFYSLFFRQGLPANIQFRLLPKEPPREVEDFAVLRHIFSEAQLMYHRAFFQAGISALIENWLNRNCAESPEELYEILRMEYQPERVPELNRSGD